VHGKFGTAVLAKGVHPRVIPDVRRQRFVQHRKGLLEHQCYRSVDEKLLAKVQIKRLKPVVRYIMDLKLPGVTEALIRATLKRAGMQLPRSRAS
jgi:hypothetical protein